MITAREVLSQYMYYNIVQNYLKTCAMVTKRIYVLRINPDNYTNRQTQILCNNNSHLIISYEHNLGNDNVSVISVYDGIIST